MSKYEQKMLVTIERRSKIKHQNRFDSSTNQQVNLYPLVVVNRLTQEENQSDAVDLLPTVQLLFPMQQGIKINFVYKRVKLLKKKKKKKKKKKREK